MSTLRTIRARIASVEKIKKITNALEIVALTRLRRMEEDTITARSYFDNIRKILLDVTSNINFKAHPFLLERKPPRNIAVITIFSDKGLCGNFNANIIHKFIGFTSDKKDKKIKIVNIGKKGMKYIKQRTDYEISSSYLSSENRTLQEGITEICHSFIQGFLNGEIDEINLIYSKFRRHLLGEVNIIRLLPFSLDINEVKKIKKRVKRDYIYEPGVYSVFDSLVREYIVNQIHQGILESRCAEEMSRMLAMKSASENADEMISRLDLTYHKSRQAQITRELTEVITAAEAAV